MGVIYVICLLLGIPVAWVCGYTKWYDVIEFTITYMTTAGLLSFDRDNSHGPIYFVSACYIALAIPVAAVFISELASEAFAPGAPRDLGSNPRVGRFRCWRVS